MNFTIIILLGALASGSIITPATINLGTTPTGTPFIRTNTNSVPFYFVSDRLNLLSMIGHPLDTNVINSSRMFLTSQHMPSAVMKDGHPMPGPGYTYISGRYSVLDERILTLTDFEIETSAEEGAKDNVRAVRVNSASFNITAELAAEARKLLK